MKPTARPNTLPEVLARQGYRLTGPRRAILAVLGTGDGPLTVEEIRARLDSDSVHRVTVYRTVHLLVRAGILRAVDAGREGLRYEMGEPFTGHHAFLICQQCGRIDTTPGCPLPDKVLARLRRRLERVHQFRVIDHEVRLLGLCHTCHA